MMILSERQLAKLKALIGKGRIDCGIRRGYANPDYITVSVGSYDDETLFKFGDKLLKKPIKFIDDAIYIAWEHANEHRLIYRRPGDTIGAKRSEHKHSDDDELIMGMGLFYRVPKYITSIINNAHKSMALSHGSRK